MLCGVVFLMWWISLKTFSVKEIIMKKMNEEENLKKKIISNK